MPDLLMLILIVLAVLAPAAYASFCWDTSLESSPCWRSRGHWREAGARGIARHTATTGGLRVGLLLGVIVIVGGLTYFPALALGPFAEHMAMLHGTVF